MKPAENGQRGGKKGGGGNSTDAFTLHKICGPAKLWHISWLVCGPTFIYDSNRSEALYVQIYSYIFIYVSLDCWKADGANLVGRLGCSVASLERGKWFLLLSKRRGGGGWDSYSGANLGAKRICAKKDITPWRSSCFSLARQRNPDILLFAVRFNWSLGEHRRTI